MPLAELHAAAPHEQSIVLSEDPSMLVQTSPLEQVLVEKEQYRPVTALHEVEAGPHAHAIEFANELSVLVHAIPLEQVPVADVQ